MSIGFPFVVLNVGPLESPATQLLPFNQTQQLVTLQLVSVRELHFSFNTIGCEEYWEHKLSLFAKGAKSSLVILLPLLVEKIQDHETHEIN